VTDNELHVEAFSAAAFIETVQQAGGGIVTRQVEYLAAYLETLKVTTVVRETRYIDRHYAAGLGQLARERRFAEHVRRAHQKIQRILAVIEACDAHLFRD
jgi:hypothetical protein